MATRNKYVYWGDWGLPIGGVMGRTAIVGVIITIGKLFARVAVLVTQGKATRLGIEGVIRRD